jgi:hypothetical protein
MRKKYQRLQDWERQAIVDGYANGEKLAVLATEFNSSDSTISRIAERAGLARRRHISRDPPVKFEGKRTRKRLAWLVRQERVKRRADANRSL